MGRLLESASDALSPGIQKVGDPSLLISSNAATEDGSDSSC
jgi:hypothetical protein